MTDAPMDRSLRLDGDLGFLVYGIATFVAAATLGPAGILMGLAAIGFWAWVLRGPSRPRRLLMATLWALILVVLVVLLLPLFGSAREAAYRMHCSNNLKQISRALHAYHVRYETLPPAYVADAAGRPMHSWRVLILPFMEYQHQQLYEQYRFDEPWDGPNNRTLASQMPSTYICPSETKDGRMRSTTSYVAVVGPETAWPLDRGRPLEEFAEPATTLWVLENRRGKVPWMEPRDLSFEEAVVAFSAPELEDYSHVQQGFFHDCAWGRSGAFADGHVRWIGNLTRAFAAELLRVEKGIGESSEFAVISDRPPPYHQPNYGNWARLAIFLLLLLLPLGWVWREPRNSLAHAVPQSIE